MKYCVWQKETNFERNIEIDVIRIICCMMVVMIHMPKFYDSEIRIIVDVITHCAVPCFMAISGYLLFFRREYSYKQVLLGPFKKYLILFLIWMAIYIGYNYSNTDKTEAFWRYAITNSEGWHLWYLKVYLQIIVVYPIIKAITSKKELTLFYSVFWFVFLPVRFSIGHIPGVEFTFLRVIQLPFFQYSGTIGGTVLGYHPTECVGLFIAGGGYLKYLEELRKKEEHSDKFRHKLGCFVVVGLIGFIIALTATHAAARVDEALYLASITCFHFYFLMIAIGLIAAVYLTQSFIDNDLFCYVVRTLSDRTLGVYILHPLICSLLTKWLFLTGLKAGNGRNMIIVIFTFLLSFLVVTILHLILPKKVVRYIF